MDMAVHVGSGSCRLAGDSRIGRVLSVLVAAGSFFLLSAMPVHAIDLKEVFLLAIEEDPRFVGTGYESEATREVLRQAWGGVFPSLTAEGVHTETTQNIVSTDNEVFGSGKSDFPTTEYTL
ncbi:MAG TPA: hypothetical protein ENN89_05500, partial [Synergistetes bacterium]|nr:hypothetical protein [Synergistota bacterium]